MSKNVGVLTGGGDCPGLNAVIRAVTRRSLVRGHTVVGIREGWRGLVDGRFMELGPREISGILPRGGTILGTTRTNPYTTDGGVEKVLENFRAQSLDGRIDARVAFFVVIATDSHVPPPLLMRLPCSLVLMLLPSLTKLPQIGAQNVGAVVTSALMSVPRHRH